MLSLWIANAIPWRFRLKTGLIFIFTYLLIALLVVPLTAPFFGREKIRVTNNLKPANYLTVLLNRDYVTPSLAAVLEDLSSVNKIRYLDAGFPFVNGFPLLPHLSHDDGRKMDLSFIYQDSEGEPTHKIRSRSGYGIFARPLSDEFDQTKACKHQGYWQYDYARYLSFGSRHPELEFSEKYTRKLLIDIISQQEVEKIFLEPHLAQRLNLQSDKIRFHGCRSVRHDDHIHFQVK